jgi:citronellyl-CoA dehydrogenase
MLSTGRGIRPLFASRFASGSAIGSNFPYDETHIQLQNTIKQFIDNEVNPHCDEWEKAGIFPAHEIFKGLGKLGVLGLTKPVEDGGSGLDYSYSVAAAEALGHCHSGGIPMAIGVQTDMATPALARFGNKTVREEFLQPSITGEKVACLGVSEVGAGSDVSGVKTTAVRDGDDYIINGGKMWTTNGTQADWMCALVNTSDAKESGGVHRNKSLICIPMNSPGVSIARTLDKIGMRSSDTAQVFLDNVRVPASYLIGEPGHGFKYQMMQFQEERLFCVATSLIPFDNCIDNAVSYTSDRKIFGKPVINNQAVRFRLSELAVEVEALRALCYRATSKYIAGEDVTMLASMAKFKAGKLGQEVPNACLQYYGGMGFMNETLITRQWRDLRLLSIGGGADEVMLEVISKLRGIGN